jgi:hypothetical protein
MPDSRTMAVLDAAVQALQAASYTVGDVTHARPAGLVVQDHPLFEVDGNAMAVVPAAEDVLYNTASGVGDRPLTFDVEISTAAGALAGYRALDPLRTWAIVAVSNSPAVDALVIGHAKETTTRWFPADGPPRHTEATCVVRFEVRHRTRTGDPTQQR